MNKIKNFIQKGFSVDVRVLALFRIVFGFLGLLDVLRRYHLIDVFYSTSGMNLRSKYSMKYFTLLDYFQTTAEVQIFFIITAFCFICLIFGYRTKLFQILCAIGLISIHNAAVMLENGGDMVFNNYLIWTIFLPLGASCSIDSIRKSLKRYKEYTPYDLNKEIKHDDTQIFHFAYVACLVQLSMIYFYASINKTAAMWKDGTAVHYAYQLETFLTPLGELISQYMNFELSYLMTHAAPHAQLFAPIGILFPILQPWMRRMVFITFVGFHGLIEICFSIGLFGWVMFAALLLLLSQEDINIMKTILSRFCKKKYTVFYDRDCGFCHFIARIIKRMDIFSRLTWTDRLLENRQLENIDDLMKNTIVILDPETDEVWTRHRGFAKIISVLPFGFLFAWILCIPGLEKLFGYIYDLISNNRIHLSKIMGLPACDIAERKINSTSSKPNNPIFSMGRKTIGVISNLLVLSLLIGAVDYSTKVNKGYQNYFSKKDVKIKKFRKTRTYKIQQKMRRILLYPRMHQNWNMFAPSVLRNEKWVIAEVTFSDGEKLSLFKENEKVEENFEYQYFTKKNQFWRKFFSRINKSAGYRKHIPQFKKWLKNNNYFYEYAGREVIDVKVWQLSEYSPSLDTNPKDKPKVRKVELFSRKNILKNRTKKNKSKDGNILDIIKKRNKTLNN